MPQAFASSGVQHAAVGLIVLAAAFYIGVRIVRSLRGRGKSGCNNCPQDAVTRIESKPLVTVDSLRDSIQDPESSLRSDQFRNSIGGG